MPEFDYQQLKRALSMPSSASYATRLSLPDEIAFRSWVGDHSIPYDLSTPLHMQDYDMRGFWVDNVRGNPDYRHEAGQHFTDRYKTPLHESFSNESIYATEGAPRWVGKKLIGPDGRVVFEE